MTGGLAHRAIALSACVLVAASGAAILAAPSARSQLPTLLGWTAQADANAIDVVVDDVSGLAGSHPLTEADVPEDSADYETGPYGHGLASVVWPGATAGNLGSLSGELGLPASLAPLAAKANDEIKAEAFYPYGPQNASYPPGGNGGIAEMTSRATANGVTSTSALSDLKLLGTIGLSGIKGTSTATASGVAQASASASFAQLSLLDGLITIGATSSTASVQSDGDNPNGNSTTHLGAIEILGHVVSIGSDGLVIGPLTTTLLGSLLAPTLAEVNSLISALGLTITPLPEVVTSKAPVESVTSGGLRVRLALPSTGVTSLDCSSLPAALSQLAVLCTLPGLLQGANVTITVGRVTATAIATPAFTSPPGAGNGTPPPAPTGALPPVASQPPGGSGTSPGNLSGGASGRPSPASASLPAAVAPLATPTGGGRGPSQTPAAGPLSTVALSTPIKSGLALFVLIVAALVGIAAIRAGRHLDDPIIDGACIREKTPT